MGYLDAYGAGVERRNRRILYSILGVFLALVAAVLLYFQFRDYSEHKRVDAFLAKLRAKDYRAAYEAWGCTASAPCRDYSFDKFMEDWGPRSPYADPGAFEVAETHSCEAGVIEVLRYPGRDAVNLWVDRKSTSVSFAPWTLKPIPADARSRFSAVVWSIRRNCKPLIGP